MYNHVLASSLNGALNILNPMSRYVRNIVFSSHINIMPKHTNWSKSEGKAFLVEQFETRKLDPDNLPDLGEYKELHSNLFGTFALKNFKNNVRNLANHYSHKFRAENRRVNMEFGSKLIQVLFYLFLY